MHTVITFDVSDDRTRYRVARGLLDRGPRVQKSVFESPGLDRAAYLRLRSDLEGLVDATTDSLRYYRLCATCMRRIEHHGVGPGPLLPPPPFDIIDGG